MVNRFETGFKPPTGGGLQSGLERLHKTGLI